MQVEMPDPYERGAFVPLLKKKPVQIWTDLDSTMTDGHGDPSERELEDRAGVRRFARERGIMAGALTARSIGLTLDRAAFQASVATGFAEPEPKWDKDPITGLHRSVDLGTQKFFDHCLNWHVVGSLGGGIVVKNGNGYVVDHEYHDKLNHDHLDVADRANRIVIGQDIEVLRAEVTPPAWRIAALQFVMEHCPELLEYMPDIEYRARYEKGVANVAPQPARIQFNCTGSAGLDLIKHFLWVLEKERQAGNRLAVRIHPSSEDRIDAQNPEKSRYTFYLLPWYGLKHKMFNRAIARTAHAAGRSVRELLVAYAGDAVTDLDTILKGGGDARVISVLPTGSRLTRALVERWEYYGTYPLHRLWANPAKNRHQDRLQQVTGANREGVYEFHHKIRGYRRNLLVIGDIRYPGETAPGSVLRFLEEFVPTTPHYF